MKTFNAIILAGGEGGPLHDHTGYGNKAMIPIHGKPMLQWVVDAFRKSESIGRIVVVGPDSLDGLECIRHVTKRIPAAGSLMNNILMGIGYMKAFVYRGKEHHSGYVISFCDAVFLTPETISRTMNRIEQYKDPDMVLNYVEKHTFDENGIHARRTYIPIEGKYYTGGTLYYIRKLSGIATVFPRLRKLRKVRKAPRGLLDAVGCGGMTMDQIQRNLSRLARANVKIRICPDPGMGMDVDKPEDLKLATTRLRERG